MRCIKQTPGVIRDPAQVVAAARQDGGVLPARPSLNDLIKLSPLFAEGVLQSLG